MKKETKIALTAIVSLVLLFIGINFLKGINVFQSTNTYYVKLRDAAGLSVSNPVYANGYPVGIVRTIQYDYARGEHVIVGIELDHEMRVPQATRAELQTELMGGVKMLLILGPNPTKHIAQGDTIAGSIYEGAMDKVSAMVPTLTRILPKLDSIAASLNTLLADPALTHTLHNAEALSANLKATSEQLNTLMQSDVPVTLANLKLTSAHAAKLSGNLAQLDFQQTLNSVNQTVDQANQFTNRLNTLTTDLDHKLKGKDNTLGLLLNDRSMYDNLNATLANADSLVIDLKAHPKRYVHFSVFGKKDK